MADLRDLLSQLGYRDVGTLLQSGNAVFTAEGEPAAIERQIERAINDKLGLTVRCLVRRSTELNAVINANPLSDVAVDGSKMMALFLSAKPDAKLLVAHDPAELSPEEIRVGDRVIYQWCPDGLLAAPPVGTFVEKHLGVAVTARNWNTVTKLAAMLSA